MKTGMSMLGVALVFFMVAGMVYVEPAYAQRGRSSVRSSRGGSSSRNGISSRSRSGSRSSGSSLRGLQGLRDLGSRSSRGSQSSKGLQGLGDLFDLGRRYGGYGDRYGDRYGYGDRHDGRYDSDRAYADAMRDAAIANAIVGVVGIIANTATSPYGVRQVPYGTPQYQTPYSTPTYRIERVLVREGHYEEYEAWVPDTYDPQTGETIKGHQVVRQRYVPEVWEERQVRVTPQY